MYICLYLDALVLSILQTKCAYHIARSLLKKLRKPDDAICEFFLPRDMPKFCCGCFSCIRNGIEACPHSNKMQPILNGMYEADLMIFTTPVYVMRTSGSMKAFLDHCFAL
ncbi:flavodoxin family protein [Raoultibacter massiliensis]|uniref:flavodoxin family protein n=1 Tax=Raoultibacter massiliensis TaxID=1852371 RepID=UPI003A929795